MFQLALPWVLLALPLPWFIWRFMPPLPTQSPSALKVPFFNHIRPMIEQKRHQIPRQTDLMTGFLIWSLLLLACSGPRWIGPPEPLTRDGYNIMLALDISLSMGVRDRVIHHQAATRLDVVKQTAQRFIHDRSQDKLGLILFGERAYLLSPLTYDHPTIIQRIDEATPGLAGQSTAIGDALGLAIKRLQTIPSQGRMIILLTDGANNAGILPPIKAAQIAHDKNIRIYTIGLGESTDISSFDQMFLSMNRGGSDLDEATLKKIARLTGGRYFRATNMQSLQNIYQSINRIEKVSQNQLTVRPQHEYYPWPLALALLLVLNMLLQPIKLIRRKTI